MIIQVLDDASPADWIVGSAAPWTQLVTFGPEGFGAYARLRFLPDPEFVGQKIKHAAPFDRRHREGREGAIVADLCSVLANATTTPEVCYFAVWSGYYGVSQEVSETAIFHVPNRQYYLFSGTLADTQSWVEGPRSEAAIFQNPPAMVWPADHAWFLACDTDPHWAGIGADVAVIERLVERNDLDIVRASPSDPQPMYR